MDGPSQSLTHNHWARELHAGLGSLGTSPYQRAESLALVGRRLLLYLCGFILCVYCVFISIPLHAYRASKSLTLRPCLSDRCGSVWSVVNIVYNPHGLKVLSCHRTLLCMAGQFFRLNRSIQLTNRGHFKASGSVRLGSVFLALLQPFSSPTIAIL